MKPNNIISELIREAVHLKDQAEQELSSGIHSDGVPVISDLIIGSFAPHGSKRAARSLSKSVLKKAKAKATMKWRKEGDKFIIKCESEVRNMSEITNNLTISGNSQRLLRKFNKSKQRINPIPFFNGLITALTEIQNLDLIWNNNIQRELALRKETALKEKTARNRLKSNSKTITKLAKSVNLYDRHAISQHLKEYESVWKSIVGAMDRVQAQDQDSERHCITSCRAAIESICARLGNSPDWKTGLSKLFPSETDQRQVKGVWNYLSNKGAHGGHMPTKEEAEYALKLTIATIEYVFARRNIKGLI